MKRLLLLAPLALYWNAFSQGYPVMKTIPGGTCNLGGGFQYVVKDYYMILLGTDHGYAELTKDQIVIGEVPAENNPTLRVTVSSFYLSETEVTNAQYRMFLTDSLLSATEKATLDTRLKQTAKGDQKDGYRSAWQPLVEKAGKAGLLPDTLCWTTDFAFAYNDPLVNHYLLHSSFDSYPVVGVSWDQAQAYCAWLTRTVNADRRKRGKAPLPAYRLPTEMEWEFAAKERPKQEDADKTLYGSSYPWEDHHIQDAKGQYLANIKTDHGNYTGDNYSYTAPVRSFRPNSNGLYHMAGNVAEWCEDAFTFRNVDRMHELNPARQDMPRLFAEAVDDTGPYDDWRVVKGGSWADYRYAALIGSRTGQSQGRGSSRVGFRVAMIQSGEE